MPACLALAALTHWAWPLALLLEPRAQNPLAPGQVSLFLLILPRPAIRSSVHSTWRRWGPGKPKYTHNRSEIPVQHVIELWLVGQEENGIKGNEYIDKNKNTQITRKPPDSAALPFPGPLPWHQAFLCPGRCLSPFPQHLTLRFAPPPMPWLLCLQSPAELVLPASPNQSSAPWLSGCFLVPSRLPSPRSACCLLSADDSADDSGLAFKPCSASVLNRHHHASHFYSGTRNTPSSWEH